MPVLLVLFDLWVLWIGGDTVDVEVVHIVVVGHGFEPNNNFAVCAIFLAFDADVVGGKGSAPPGT